MIRCFFLETVVLYHRKIMLLLFNYANNLPSFLLRKSFPKFYAFDAELDAGWMTVKGNNP